MLNKPPKCLVCCRTYMNLMEVNFAHHRAKSCWRRPDQPRFVPVPGALKGRGFSPFEVLKGRD